MHPKSPCYGCLSAPVCELRETFESLNANIDTLKIKKADPKEVGGPAFTIRVEHRFSDGPALAEHLQSLGITSARRTCTLKKACPIPPWWSDPVRDNGVPIGYPTMDIPATDARYCDGSKIPYIPRHMMRRTNIITTRNDNFGINCATCQFRDRAYDNQLEQLINSSAATFAIEYTDFVRRGDRFYVSNYAKELQFMDYVVDTEKTAEMFTVNSERDMIVIYYKYKAPNIVLDEEIGKIPTMNELADRGELRSFTLRFPKVASPLDKLMFNNTVWYIGNVTAIATSQPRKLPDGTVITKQDIERAKGVDIKLFDDVLSSEKDAGEVISIPSIVASDDIRFTIDSCTTMHWDPNNPKSPNYKLWDMLYNAMSNCIHGNFEIKSIPIISDTNIVSRMDGGKVTITCRQRFEVVIHYYQEKVLDITPIMTIDHANHVNVEYRMSTCSDSPAYLGRKVGELCIPKYCSDPMTEIVDLPKNDEIDRRGFILTGYLPAFMRDLAESIDEEQCRWQYSTPVLDPENPNAKLIVYLTDSDPEEYKNEKRGNLYLGATWVLDPNYFANHVMSAVKHGFPDFTPGVTIDGNYLKLNLKGLNGTDAPDKLYEALSTLKLDLANDGFQVDVYMAPELADESSYSIIQHHIDNKLNTTPVVIVDHEEALGELKQVQLLPINLDNFHETMERGVYNFMVVIYPNDMSGIVGYSYIARRIDLEVTEIPITVTKIYHPSDDVDTAEPFMCVLDGVREEDVDRVTYENGELVGVAANDYTVSKINSLKRCVIHVNVGIHFPTAVPSVPVLSQQFQKLCRNLDTCVIKVPIANGVTPVALMINDQRVEIGTDDYSYNPDTRELTIKLYDVSTDMEIDVISADQVPSDPINVCENCKDLVSLADYPWLETTLTCKLAKRFSTK